MNKDTFLPVSFLSFLSTSLSLKIFFCVPNIEEWFSESHFVVVVWAMNAKRSSVFFMSMVFFFIIVEIEDADHERKGIHIFTPSLAISLLHDSELFQ